MGGIRLQERQKSENDKTQLESNTMKAPGDGCKLHLYKDCNKTNPQEDDAVSELLSITNKLFTIFFIFTLKILTSSTNF